MVKDAKKAVRELADQVGKPEARRLLVDEGVSTSTADKLVRDCYDSEVGLLVRGAVERALQTARNKKLIA